MRCARTSGVELNADQLRQITAYLRELGREEGPASAPVGEGTGLVGRYFNNMTLSGNPVFTREENIDFNWKSNKPAPGVNANGFSVRWNGELEVPVTGTYDLQTVGDDGIRLYVNQQLLVDRWVNRSSDHGHNRRRQPDSRTAGAHRARSTTTTPGQPSRGCAGDFRVRRATWSFRHSRCIPSTKALTTEPAARPGLPPPARWCLANSVSG